MNLSSEIEGMSNPQEPPLTSEQVEVNNHRLKIKNKLQLILMQNYMKNYPRSNPEEWIEAFSADYGKIVDRNHHILPNFESSEDEHPDAQQVIIDKVEKELYQI